MVDKSDCTCGHVQQFGRYCKKCGGLKNPNVGKMAGCESRHRTVTEGDHCVDCGEKPK